MTSTQRTFFALRVPEEFRTALTDCCESMRGDGSLAKLSPRWVRGENMHVTLRFLGDMSTQQLDSLCGILDERLAREAAFATQCLGLVGFPNAKRAHVLAARLSVPSELAQLARDIDARATAAGSPGEHREYVPHVTLARMKRRGPIPTPERLSFEAAVSLSEVVLYAPSLSPEGPRYRELRIWTLVGP